VAILPGATGAGARLALFDTPPEPMDGTAGVYVVDGESARTLWPSTK
jgi:hypothetical protein